MRVRLESVCRSVGWLVVLSLAGVVVAPATAFDPATDSDPLHFEIVAGLSDPEVAPRGLSVRSTPEQRELAATFLVDVLRAGGLEPQRHRYRHRNANPLVDLLLPPFRGTNVYAVLEATEAGAETVIVGAHYDSEPGSPGAGDNAAGVALVVSLARELQETYRPYRYVFVLFDQEEDDEIGSRAFVRYLRTLDWTINSAHILDVVAWDEDGDRALEVQISRDYALQAVYTEVAAQLGIEVTFTGGRGASDNRSFADAGYSTAGLWGDEITPHMHRDSDTWDTVDFGLMETAEELLFGVLVSLPGRIGGSAEELPGFGAEP